MHYFYSAARRAIPPLPQEGLKVLSQHSSDMRRDLQMMKRRKILQVRHEMHRKLIRDYFSSSPQNFWDVFKKGLRAKCELEDVDACTVYF